MALKVLPGLSELRRTRMAERAAHLVNHVPPDVPIRQWMLSLLYQLAVSAQLDVDFHRAVGVHGRAVIWFLR
jgi:hypothetical protein